MYMHVITSEMKNMMTCRTEHQPTSYVQIRQCGPLQMTTPHTAHMEYTISL